MLALLDTDPLMRCDIAITKASSDTAIALDSCPHCVFSIFDI